MKVLKVSAPLALLGIAIAYMLVNIAYYAVVPVDVIAASKRILVADFFYYAFGSKASKAAAVFVALSAWGNVMSVIFSQGRIITQLGRSGVIPFSRFFGSSKPFNTPFTGLLEHWIIGVIFICAVPPGDSYNFILNLVSYPLNVINTLLGAGLVWIYIRKYQGKYEWNPKIKATFPVAVFFFLSSLYLVAAPIFLHQKVNPFMKNSRTGYMLLSLGVFSDSVEFTGSFGLNYCHVLAVTNWLKRSSW